MRLRRCGRTLTAHSLHTRRGGLLTGCDEDAPRSPRRAGIPMRGFDRFRVSSTERDFPLTQEHDWVRGDTVAVNTKLKNSQLNTPATALRSSALDSCAQSCSNWPWPSCAATDRTKEPRKSYPVGPRRGYPGWAGPLLAGVPRLAKTDRKRIGAASGAAERGSEPSTIERPRMRARFVDQGEPARPPGEGRREDHNAAALARGDLGRAVDALGIGGAGRSWRRRRAAAEKATPTTRETTTPAVA